MARVVVSIENPFYSPSPIGPISCKIIRFFSKTCYLTTPWQVNHWPVRYTKRSGLNKGKKLPNLLKLKQAAKLVNMHFQKLQIFASFTSWQASILNWIKNDIIFHKTEVSSQSVLSEQNEIEICSLWFLGKNCHHFCWRHSFSSCNNQS